jgi:hypothetical protein
MQTHNPYVFFGVPIGIHQEFSQFKKKIRVYQVGFNVTT